MPTPLILTAASPQEITLKMIEAGLMLIGEGAPYLAPGVTYSHIDNKNAFVSLDDSIKNLEEIKKALTGYVNLAGAPVRMLLGGESPVIEPSLNDLQIRLALVDMNLRDAVDSYVAKSDQETKDWWDRAPRFLKSDPRIQAAAKQLGVPAEGLDALWALGVTK